jgi:hypothetical protein
MARPGKIIISAVVIAACVLTFLETRRVARLRRQVESLQQEQTRSMEKIRQLQRQRDRSMDQWALRCDTSNQPDRNLTELLRLRGQVTMLRQQLSEKLQEEQRNSRKPLAANRKVSLSAGPKLSVSYDSALWSPVSTNRLGVDGPESMTWEFDATGTGWAQITVSSYHDRMDEATYKQQILDAQKLRGDPAELVSQHNELIGGRQWMVLELRNGSTKPARTELHYFFPSNDGHINAFVVAEEANMPLYRENVEDFIRQIQLE